ncbi:hypothetical protein [Rhodococcus opacus]|uniref:Uncharacterized protein n=1 Tax=Rhodococcus opacus (strain B4) TaxID=632772 RepID=C1B9B4_RHOOB|nr:hypothetical protein [Rhodococcus opacus]BAH52267.1 hypothetical protein ROP_40200 [Rhodococcus opacus B4]
MHHKVSIERIPAADQYGMEFDIERPHPDAILADSTRTSKGITLTWLIPDTDAQEN